MKALIIDDESKSRNLLRTILNEYCPEITIIVEAEDLPSGVKTIHKEHPHIVFLDIEMPGYLGTQIMDFFDENTVDFQIIFTTAYNEYAIKAFELNAIDYLLKPMRPKKVCNAVQKALKINNHQQINEQLKELKKSITNFQFGKIGLPISDGILYVKLSEIIFFKAEGMYTHVHTLKHNKLLISKPLKHFTNLLEDNESFYRTHRSFLINLEHIRQLVKKEGTYILMDNDATVAVSKERQSDLINLLNQMF